jgi:deazaflavin-dependent oxidoreductase (nitroreductase family)
MTSHAPAATTIRLLRAPTHLYDWHAGWILGRRFLRITHIGRRSGRQYQPLLEVIAENQTSHEVIVIAGLGRSANWYRNLQTHEATEVAIASHHAIASSANPRRPPSSPTTSDATASSPRSSDASSAG